MDRDEEDRDFWPEHPDPTDADIDDLCRAWVTYQRESRERDERRGEPGPPGPDDRTIAAGPTWTVYTTKRRPEDEDQDEPGWWAAEDVMAAGSHGGLPLQWRIILGLCAAVAEDDGWTIGMIGVGPIEEILMEHGERAMGLIELGADSDAILHTALASVWLYREPIRPGSIATSVGAQ
jgi:hypothetical protein